MCGVSWSIVGWKDWSKGSMIAFLEKTMTVKTGRDDDKMFALRVVFSSTTAKKKKKCPRPIDLKT